MTLPSGGGAASVGARANARSIASDALKRFDDGDSDVDFQNSQRSLSRARQGSH